MPHGDRTGPLGGGPKTGRAAGFCAGSGVPGYMNPGYGANISEPLRGVGRGGIPWGGGRGRAWGGRRRSWEGPIRLGRGFGVPYNEFSESPYKEQPGQEHTTEKTKSNEIEALKAQAENLKTSIEAIENRFKNTHE